jgi:hypothetical protein
MGLVLERGKTKTRQVVQIFKQKKSRETLSKTFLILYEQDKIDSKQTNKQTNKKKDRKAES